MRGADECTVPQDTRHELFIVRGCAGLSFACKKKNGYSHNMCHTRRLRPRHLSMGSTFYAHPTRTAHRVSRRSHKAVPSHETQALTANTGEGALGSGGGGGSASGGGGGARARGGDAAVRAARVRAHHTPHGGRDGEEAAAATAAAARARRARRRGGAATAGAVAAPSVPERRLRGVRVRRGGKRGGAGTRGCGGEQAKDPCAVRRPARGRRVAGQGSSPHPTRRFERVEGTPAQGPQGDQW